jgi:hypothetical protein
VEEVVPIVEVARGDVDGEGDGKVGSDDEEISGGEAEARMREGRGRTKKVAEKIVEKPVAKVTTKGFPMERNEGLLGEDWLEQVVWDVETRTSPPRRAPLLLDANDRNMIFAVTHTDTHSYTHTHTHTHTHTNTHKCIRTCTHAHAHI